MTGSLGAGLIAALALAGLAYWERSVAVEQRRIADQQRQIAEQQRQRAEDTLVAATETANKFGLRSGAAVPQCRQYFPRHSSRTFSIAPACSRSS